MTCGSGLAGPCAQRHYRGGRPGGRGHGVADLWPVHLELRLTNGCRSARIDRVHSPSNLCVLRGLCGTKSGPGTMVAEHLTLDPAGNWTGYVQKTSRTTVLDQDRESGDTMLVWDELSPKTSILSPEYRTFGAYRWPRPKATKTRPKAQTAQTTRLSIVSPEFRIPRILSPDANAFGLVPQITIDGPPQPKLSQLAVCLPIFPSVWRLVLSVHFSLDGPCMSIASVWRRCG